MKYKHIAIEGNIGSGKTTLAKMLASDYNMKLILEEFDDNPFLPNFYKNPEKNVLPLELFFLAERYNQLKKNQEKDLFQSSLISDYFFIKSKLFAQNNLKDDELQLFNRLFDIMCPSILVPDLVVYLYSDIIKLQSNIKKRGRIFEQNISNDYLQNLQSIYLDYLKKQDVFPVLILDITDVDFVLDMNIYTLIKEFLSISYDKGVYNKILKNQSQSL
tara:strand:+ start:462 stop:1112 length:651 start_codon:yes stop_codon:yes gene_type:complete